MNLPQTIHNLRILQRWRMSDSTLTLTASELTLTIDSAITHLKRQLADLPPEHDRIQAIARREALREAIASIESILYADIHTE